MTDENKKHAVGVRLSQDELAKLDRLVTDRRLASGENFDRSRVIRELLAKAKIDE